MVTKKRLTDSGRVEKRGQCQKMSGVGYFSIIICHELLVTSDDEFIMVFMTHAG